MRRGKQIYDWFPLWSDKWLFGSTRHELTHEQRAIWTDLMALANKDDGFIRANETTAYPPEQLSGLLCCSLELLVSTLQRCITTGKLEDVGDGIYYVINWTEYQLSGRYKRLIAGKTEQASGKTDTSNLFLSSSSSELDKGFNQFWEKYPRKSAKEDAIKAWGQAIEAGATPESISEAVAGYRKLIEKRNLELRLIKLPATFLRSKRWRDYLPDGGEMAEVKVAAALDESKKRRLERETLA